MFVWVQKVLNRRHATAMAQVLTALLHSGSGLLIGPDSDGLVNFSTDDTDRGKGKEPQRPLANAQREMQVRL